MIEPRSGPQHGHGNSHGHPATGTSGHVAPFFQPPSTSHAPHPKPLEEEPIELVDEEIAADAAKKKIRAFGPDAVTRTHDWKRQTYSNQTGAARVRSFHGKLSEAGLEFLDHSVNEWLDHHPDIEVKFVTSTVGSFEGKIREPAIILNIWY